MWDVFPFSISTYNVPHERDECAEKNELRGDAEERVFAQVVGRVYPLMEVLEWSERTRKAGVGELERVGESASECACGDE